jgi:hypothetical protein
MYMPFPFQIFQTPAKLTMLFEYVHADPLHPHERTPHPPGHIDWWMGDSRGRWEGDTLVVDVVDFKRSDVVRPVRKFPQRSAAPRRALYVHGTPITSPMK